MAKKVYPGEAILFPLPLVLVTSGRMDGPRNVMTASYTATVASEPPILSVGIRPERHSHSLLRAGGELAINLPNVELMEAVDKVGHATGEDCDKFALAGLTPVRGQVIAVPLIAECPVNLECQVRQVLRLGTHDLFLVEVVCVHMAEEYRLGEGVADGLAFAFGKYYGLRGPLAAQGFTKKK